MSYIMDMASLVSQMARGSFRTYPEVARAMISLRGYLLRLRRDFEMDDFVRKEIIDKYFRIPPGTISPELFQRVGQAYEPHMRELLVRTGRAEVETMGPR